MYRLHSIILGLLKEVSDISIENFGQVVGGVCYENEKIGICGRL